jgi:hypothetical protein
VIAYEIGSGITLQINITPTDLPHLIHILPYQCRQLNDQVDEILLTVDLHRSGGGGLDHGVGHPLLLLYNVKVLNGQKSKEFKGLGHYASDASLSTV